MDTTPIPTKRWARVEYERLIDLAVFKPGCDAQGRMKAPEKVEGQVVKVDPAQGKVTVREADGTVHEFQASAETLKDLKPGDQIGAKLREAPKC